MAGNKPVLWIGKDKTMGEIVLPLIIGQNMANETIANIFAIHRFPKREELDFCRKRLRKNVSQIGEEIGLTKKEIACASTIAIRRFNALLNRYRRERKRGEKRN